MTGRKRSRDVGQVAGALVSSMLEISLKNKVPVVNGLCFSQVMGGDLLKLSERLAYSAANMGALKSAGSDSYAGEHGR